MNVALVYCPGDWLLTMPPCGIAYLSAHLKQRGHRTECFDYNIDMIASAARDQAGDLDAVFEAMRGEQFYDMRELGRYNHLLEVEGAGLLKQIEACAAGDDDSWAGRYFRDRVAELIEFDVVGLSVSFDVQITAAVVLAKLLKRARPEIRVAVGGTAAAFRPFNGIVDTVVHGDGEHPFAEYLDRLEAEAGKPRTRLKLAESTTLIGPYTQEDLDTLPTPDFDDFFRKYRYHAPHNVIPLMITRGCYWGVCQFCSIGFNRDCGAATAKYRRQRVDKIVGQLRELGERHRTRYFYFPLDVADAPLLKNLSIAIPREGIDVHWRAEIRAEKKFLDRDLLDTLYRGGCRTISFGLESLNQRVLDAMNKGTAAEVNAKIIDALYDAGIGINTDFFIGFPTETPAEAVQTQRFVLEKNDKIVSYHAGGAFLMFARSPMASQKEVPGLRYDVDTGEWVKSGMTYAQTDRQQQIAWSTMLFTKDIARFPLRNDSPVYFLFCSRYSVAEITRLCRERRDHLMVYEQALTTFEIVFHYLGQLKDGGSRPALSDADKAWAEQQIAQVQTRRDNLRVHYELVQRMIAAAGLAAADRHFVEEVARLCYYLIASALSEGELPMIWTEPAVRGDAVALDAMFLVPPASGAEVFVASFDLDVAAVQQRAPIARARAATPAHVVFDLNGAHVAPDELEAALFQRLVEVGGRRPVGEMLRSDFARYDRARVRQALRWACQEALLETAAPPGLESQIADILGRVQNGTLNPGEAGELLSRR